MTLEAFALVCCAAFLGSIFAVALTPSIAFGPDSDIPAEKPLDE